MQSPKEKITAALKKAGEATAKELARATKLSETEVINTLNAMGTYTEVEFKSGGRGKGNIYWLTAAGATEPDPGSDTACLNRIADLESGIDSAQQTIHTMELEAEQKEQEVISLRDRLEALTNEHIDLQSQVGRLQMHSTMLGQIAAIVADYLPEGAYTTHEGVAMMDQLIAVQHAELVNERLAARLFDESVKLSEKRATRYMVLMPNKTPVIRCRLETARATAMAGARSVGMAEVFALIPAGKAVRGAEWKEAVNG